MEDIYKFQLDEDAFDRILAGKKTAHLVLNDNKHKNYAVGNQITFFKVLDETVDNFDEVKTEINATIENLLYFGDVKEAVETLGKETCGFRSSATFEKASDLFMSGESYENIEKYGIVAIVFKVIE